MSNSLRSQGLRHASLPCLSLAPGVCSNSCPLSQWCYLTISSSAALFFCLQSFPTSRCFPMSRLIASGGQSIGISVSPSVLAMNIQGWFPLVLIVLLVVLGNLSSLFQHYNLKASVLFFFESINSLALRIFHGPTLISVHDYWKNHSFDYTDLCWQSDVSTF